MSENEANIHVVTNPSTAPPLAMQLRVSLWGREIQQNIPPMVAVVLLTSNCSPLTNLNTKLVLPTDTSPVEGNKASIVNQGSSLNF